MSFDDDRTIARNRDAAIRKQLRGENASFELTSAELAESRRQRERDDRLRSEAQADARVLAQAAEWRQRTERREQEDRENDRRKAEEKREKDRRWWEESQRRSQERLALRQQERESELYQFGNDVEDEDLEDEDDYLEQFEEAATGWDRSFVESVDLAAELAHLLKQRDGASALSGKVSSGEARKNLQTHSTRLRVIRGKFDELRMAVDRAGAAIAYDKKLKRASWSKEYESLDGHAADTAWPAFQHDRVEGPHQRVLAMVFDEAKLEQAMHSFERAAKVLDDLRSEEQRQLRALEEMIAGTCTVASLRAWLTEQPIVFVDWPIRLALKHPRPAVAGPHMGSAMAGASLRVGFAWMTGLSLLGLIVALVMQAAPAVFFCSVLAIGSAVLRAKLADSPAMLSPPQKIPSLEASLAETRAHLLKLDRRWSR